MIEPTDETVMALWCLLPSEVQDGRELDDIRPWVAAVLDAAARDYCLKPRGHVLHPLAGRDEWPSGRGALHPHFCVSCSNGETAGLGCINCRSTGFDQSPWPDCERCRFARRVAAP